MISTQLTAGARLLSVAGARPELTVSGDELGGPFGKDAEWVRTRTGIASLRRIGVCDDVIALAAKAGNDAVAAAGVEIDFVLTATCSAPYGTDRHEAVASRVAAGRPHAALNVACAGFCYSLAAADAMIRSGQARHVAVIAVEHMSRYIDPADLGTSIIFADGAAAAVVGPSDSPGIGPVVWGSDGEHHSMIACDATAPNYLRMQGQAVFRWAVDLVPELCIEACRRAGVTLAEIEVFVPHQANLRIVDAVTRKLGLTDAVVVADDVSVSGNTSAASVPLALAALAGAGRTTSGQLALLVGFGAGLAYAAQVVRLP